jgi:ADP-ribosylglycohydrolase
MEEVLEAGRSVLPPGSRMARAVADAVASARAETDFERVVDGLHERHGDLHWVHAINNAALVAAALAHGDGDFTRSIAAAVAGGWDTDSDGATVGSVAGALAGAARIPAHWTEPLHDRMASSLTGFDGVRIGDLAARTAALAT